MLVRIFLSLSVILMPIQPALACTTVNVSKSTNGLIGKTYDWDIKAGLVIENKANVQKTALSIGFTTPKNAEWKSKYGSVSLNQYGRELPNSGMNEKGLVVEIMWLDDTKWPAAGNDPVVSELQWVQYQLDNYATVKEMKDNADKIKIGKIQGDVHYLACDASRECATFEFLAKKEDPNKGEVVINGKLANLPVPTLTNDTYTKSFEAYRDFKKALASKPIDPPKDDESISRFIRASYLAEKFDAKEIGQDKEVSKVFEILSSVTVGDYTKWTIVYDPQNRVIHFKTLDQPKVKSINLKDPLIQTSCKTPVKMISMNTDLEGDLTPKLEEFTSAKNDKHLKEVLKGNPVALLPGLFKKVSDYLDAEDKKCME